MWKPKGAGWSQPRRAARSITPRRAQTRSTVSSPFAIRTLVLPWKGRRLSCPFSRNRLRLTWMWRPRSGWSSLNRLPTCAPDRLLSSEARPRRKVVDGLVLSGGMPVTDALPVSSIVFKPERALRGGVDYALSLTAAIKDTNNQPLKAYSSSFKTFAGMTLTQNPAGEPGSKVVLDGPYAFTVEGYKPGQAPSVYESSMLRTYDVSDPRKPVELGGGFQVPQRATDLAVSSQTRYTLPEGAVNRVGVVTSYFYWVAERPANLWILNLDNPQNPAIIGVVSLYLPIEMVTAPFCVKIHDGRAYIGNAPYRGVIVVDIQKAIELFRDGSKRADRVRPEWQAVTQYSGFGMEAIVQSTDYTDNPGLSRMATSLDVLSQNVPDRGDELMHGPMPVAFALNTGASELVALGFSPLNDGYLGYWPGSGYDRRVLSRMQLPGPPLGARVLSQIIVDGRARDVAVVLASKGTGQVLCIYDVSDATNPTLMREVALDTINVAGRAGRAFDVEGTLAYLSVGSEIAVVDFSRTDAMSLVTLLPASTNLLSSMAVHKGFIHTLSLTEGLSVRIARPVSQVFVHGKVDGDSNFCANPVIIDRAAPNHGMVGPGAEIYFQIYGKGEHGFRRRSISTEMGFRSCVTPG